jgi:hypothetical protein
MCSSIIQSPSTPQHHSSSSFPSTIHNYHHNHPFTFHPGLTPLALIGFSDHEGVSCPPPPPLETALALPLLRLLSFPSRLSSTSPAGYIKTIELILCHQGSLLFSTKAALSALPLPCLSLFTSTINPPSTRHRRDSVRKILPLHLPLSSSLCWQLNCFAKRFNHAPRLAKVVPCAV